LQAFFPGRSLRAHVDQFLEETGLGNDEQFIRELAARGGPLRQELGQAQAKRRTLGTMNQGSREYADMAASITEHYRRIYGGN
jgi:hypothetical protein